MDQENINNPGDIEGEMKIRPIVDVTVPDWFSQSVMVNLADENKIIKMVDEIEIMDLSSLNTYLGGDLDKLSYGVLRVLLPRGSDDPSVGQILGKKRTEYIDKHPEEAKVVQQPYYIDPHGVTFPDDHPFSPAELRTVAVGNTCIHYESGVSGMDDTDVKER